MACLRGSGNTLQGYHRVDIYTLWGYMSTMQTETKKSVATRLGRIEGQVRGIARMVEDDRYCIDVLTQLSAVRAALAKVEEEVLRDHVEHCVSHAMSGGTPADRQQKVDELLAVIGKLTR